MAASAPRRPLDRLVLALAALLVGALLAAPQASAAEPSVQAHLMWSRYGSSDVDAQLDAARDIGARVVRVDVGWSGLEERGKGQWSDYHLRRLDTVVTKAQERGLKLLLTFWETPCWASSAPASLKQNCEGEWWSRGVQRYAPSNPADYADALAHVVRRYGDRVAAWEIWNEPNHADYFKAGDRLASYAAMVKAAYPAAKSADSRPTILAGSLADADYQFTEELFRRGVGGHFDAWSVHPYSGDRSPLHPSDDAWIKTSFIRGVPAVRDVMLRHGQDKPLWLTEFGWSTCNVRGQQTWANCVDPSVQADYLRIAFREMQKWDYVAVGTWFNIQDTSTDEGDRVDNYGLLEPDGRQKPAYQAFREVSSALATGAPVPAPSGAHSQGRPAPHSAQRGAPKPRRLVLRVRRRRGRVYLSGTLPVGHTLAIRANRWRWGSRRFSRRATYRTIVRVGRGGRFNVQLRTRALRRGRFLITVRNRRTPRLTATAVVR